MGNHDTDGLWRNAGSARDRRNSPRRRGAVAVQVSVMLVVLTGFAALTVDVGTLYNTRTDLQLAADSAAMAAASALTTDNMLRVRLGTDHSADVATVLDDSIGRSLEFASMNPSFGLETTRVVPGDIGVVCLDGAGEVRAMLDLPGAE